MTALRIGVATLGLATVLLAGAFGWIRYGGAAPADLAALSELVLLIERTARTRTIEAGQVQARTALDYDGLVRVSRELDTAKEALKGRVAKLPPADRRLARALRRLVLAVESQDEVVERYKTDLAAILGSRRYLPEAGDAIRRLAEEMEPARREATASLRRQTDELLLALRAYEEQRLGATSAVVRASRSAPPDVILKTVHERTGDRPFGRIEEVITAKEMASLSDSYKRVAGYDRESLASGARR